MTSLPLGAVRDMARQQGYREVQHNEQSRVVAFKPTAGSNHDDLSRINVWYTTGTVGTYILHPRQGRTQLFRRNVSPNLLISIFQNPRVHTDLGYHTGSAGPKRARNGVSPQQQKRQRTNDGAQSSASNDALGEEQAAQEQMNRLISEKASLEKEIDAVGEILNGFDRRREEERKRQENEEREAAEAKERQDREKMEEIARQARELVEQQKERKRFARGKRFAYSLTYWDAEWMGDNLHDRVTCVAIGGDDGEGSATLALYEHGGSAHTGGMPKRVGNLLRSRPSHAPPPVYISLGTQGRFYIKFADGNSEWAVGSPDGLSEWLKSGRIVSTVAFGEKWEDYFVVFDDGYWAYAGGTVPAGLLDLVVEQRHSRSDLACVTIGPNGEWFLRAMNGKAWWGGVSDGMQTKMWWLRERVRTMWFGPEGTYVARYNRSFSD
jgi:hypothetical protein